MPELDRELWLDRVRQIKEQGGTEADANAYLAAKGIDRAAVYGGFKRPDEPNYFPALRTAAGLAGGIAAGIPGAPIAAATGPLAPLTEAGIVALGSQAGQKAVDLGGEVLGLRRDPRSAEQRFVGGVYDVASEFAGQLGGEAVRGGIIKGLSPLAAKFLRPTSQADRQLSQDAFQAAEQEGIPHIATTYSQRAPIKQTVRVLRQNPITTGRVETRINQIDSALTELHEKAVAKYSTAVKSPEEVGRMLQLGLKDSRRALSAWADKEEEALSHSFGPREGISVNRFLGTVDEMRRIFGARPVGAPQAPAGVADQIIPSDLNSLANAVRSSNGILTYAQVRALRTELRMRGNKPSFLMTPDDRKMVLAYEALNDDLDAAFKVAGESPRSGQVSNAYKAWQAYNKIYRSGKEQFETVEHIADAPLTYQAFDALRQGDKRAGALLWQTRKLLDKAEVPESAWNEVVALHLTEMGQKAGRKGTFDMGTFLSNFEKLDDSAKRALFIIPGNANPSDQIKRLATLLKSRRAGLGPESGSPMGMEYNKIVREGPGYLLAPMGLLTGYNVGKLVTNREFNKWLADGIAQPKLSAGSRTGHFGRLLVIAANNAGLRDAVEEYWMNLRRQENE